MSNRARVRLAALGLALAALAPGAAARAGLITESATLPLTNTDFSLSNKLTGNPLVFQKFNTQNGTLTLDSVTITLNASIQNKFSMSFTNASTITDMAYQGNPAQTAPKITIYQPDGTTALLSVTETDLSKILQSHTGTAGQTFNTSTSSLGTQTLTFTKSQPAGLALFTGSGNVSLPVSAAAFSSFISSSGNGYGSVGTSGTASVTVTYNYSVSAPQTVPEPASMALWCLGGLALTLRHRFRARRRAA
jgi:hypothetical protein